MRLNKIKLYQPNQYTSTSGSSFILDNPYDPYGWDGDTLFGPSRNSIRDMVEGLGYNAGKVIYVDITNGNDSSGRKGNVLKPFQSLYTASAYAVSGDLTVVYPGTYTLGSLGLPLKDGVDYYMLNPKFENYGFSYGLLITFPFSVTCKIFGKAAFTDHSPVGGWAMITPYLNCDLEIEGMTFISNKQILGQLGGPGSNKFLKFKNCKLISNDNATLYYSGGGFVGSALFEDCYMKGNFMVGNSGSHPAYDYKVKFNRCQLEANPTNTNGDTSFLRLVEYYGNAELSKVFIDHCVLKATQHNIEIGEGYGGIGSNKFLIVKDSYFYNASGSGWIKNEHINAGFKLINNWSQYAPSGSVAVNNLLTGAGFIYDSNLE